MVDWDSVDKKSLYKLMDEELNSQHPALKRLMDLMTKLSISPSKSPNEFWVWVEEEMAVGGIGFPENFTLTWDRLHVARVIEGLSEQHCQAILNKYSGYNITIVQLKAYLKTLSTSRVSLTCTNGQCSKGQGGKKVPASASAKCQRCGYDRGCHTMTTCKQPQCGIS